MKLSPDQRRVMRGTLRALAERHGHIGPVVMDDPRMETTLMVCETVWGSYRWRVGMDQQGHLASVERLSQEPTPA